MTYFTGVNRSACTAWSPLAGQESYFVCGTAAGSTDANFDTSAHLETFDVDLSGKEHTLQPKYKVELPDRVHSITWGAAGAAGIIAAGFPSGSISFIDAACVTGQKRSFETETIANSSKHDTPVSCAKFNAIQPQIMASGAENSEVFIWNLAKPENPVAYAPGTAPASSEAITDLQWNGQVPHILGTVSQSGRVIVWDLRNKRPVIQFTDRSGKLKSCKTISWNPKNSMQLVTASEDDSSPVVQVWNLRNTQMPISTLEGHTQGVWSTSWCPHDNRYLLSTGKENRAICWDVEAAAVVHDIPLRSEWNSSIQWSTQMQATFSVSSYQEQVGIYSIHDVRGKENERGEIIDHSHPPSWLRRPAGATFGFGGKIATVDGSSVHIKSVVSHPELLDKAAAIQEIVDLDDHQQYCNDRIEKSQSEEDKDIWKFFAAQFEQDAREAILKQISMSRADARNAVQLLQSEEQEEFEAKQEEADQQEDTEVTEETKETKEEDVSDLFAGSADDPFGGSNQDNPFGGFGDEDPFSSMGATAEQDEWDQLGSENSNSLSLDAPDEKQSQSRVSIIDMASKTGNTLHFLQGASKNEQILIRNILLKNYDEAIECCFRLNRAADALVLALSSNDRELIQQTQARYFSSLPKDSPMHFVDRLSRNKLREIIAESNVDEWKCTLAIICSYADDQEFPDLCSDLGDLLAHCGQNHAANLCYISAKNVDKAVALWDQSDEGQSRLEHLHTVMERICVFRNLTNSEDVGMETLKKYCEFAELLASQGELEQAHRFLSFLSDSSRSYSYGTKLLDRISSAISDSDSPISYPADHFVDEPQNSPSIESKPTPMDTPQNVPAQQMNVFNPSQSAPGNANQAPPMNTGSFNQPQMVNPVRPVQPVNPMRPGSFNQPQQVNPAQPMQPGSFNQPQPVPVMQPIKPVQPVNPGRTAPTVFNPYNQAPQLSSYEAPPKQESLPEAVTNSAKIEEQAPGKVEIADQLAASIQQFLSAQSSNPTAVKLAKACSDDRVKILREKLRKNELSDDTVASLERFVQAFSSGDKSGVSQEYQWLTKNKYSEVSAKVMLGLKKLLAAVEKL